MLKEIGYLYLPENIHGASPKEHFQEKLQINMK